MEIKLLMEKMIENKVNTFKVKILKNMLDNKIWVMFRLLNQITGFLLEQPQQKLLIKN